LGPSATLSNIFSEHQELHCKPIAWLDTFSDPTSSWTRSSSSLINLILGLPSSTQYTKASKIEIFHLVHRSSPGLQPCPLLQTPQFLPPPPRSLPRISPIWIKWHIFLVIQLRTLYHLSVSMHFFLQLCLLLLHHSSHRTLTSSFWDFNIIISCSYHELSILSNLSACSSQPPN
jgi:hypothetical protein